MGNARTELILVRHGQPDVTPDRAADPPLTAAGHAQAGWTAERLAREPIDCIVSSGMRRADATARPLAERLGLPVAVEPLLSEVDRVTGRYASIEAVRALGADEWRRFRAAPLAYFGVDADAFRADVLRGFDRVIDGGGRVAVFTHGFPINLLLAHALGLAHEARFAPRYGSITRLSGRSLDRLTVTSVNETTHFPDDAR